MDDNYLEQSLQKKQNFKMQANKCIQQYTQEGTWVAQLAEHPTLDFGSGHDLRVGRSSVLGVETA